VRYKGGGSGGAVRVSLTAHHAPPPQFLASDPLAPLDLADNDNPSLSDLVLLLSLFHLVTSSSVEPYPLALVPRRLCPCSSVYSPAWPGCRVPRPGCSAFAGWGGEVGEPTEQPVVA
jgi:hypothetical protein